MVHFVMHDCHALMKVGACLVAIGIVLVLMCTNYSQMSLLEMGPFMLQANTCSPFQSLQHVTFNATCKIISALLRTILREVHYPNLVDI